MLSKGASQYRFFIRRLISLSREPVVVANQPWELVVPANVGQLRNQWGRDSPVVRNLPSMSPPWKPAVLAYHHWELSILASLWREMT
jgi:hypothetical protein